MRLPHFSNVKQNESTNLSHDIWHFDISLENCKHTQNLKCQNNEMIIKFSIQMKQSISFLRKIAVNCI